jgi:hypothetical protein
MAQAVSRRPLTTEAWFRVRTSPYGICGGQCGTGTCFFSEFFGFTLSVFHRGSPLLFIIWGTNNRLIRGRSSET